MYWQIIIFSLLTFVSTFLGGLFAIKYKEKIHQVMAFAAGVLLGVVSFEILPEIIEQVNTYSFNSIDIMIALVLGFFIFHILEKTILIQHCHEEDCAIHKKHPHIGIASAAALIGHSFIDGIGIGLGFQVNIATGMLVATAVISHSFTDGLNSMAFLLNNGNAEKRSKIILLFHALAPILGAASTLLFTLSPYYLTLYLGFFAGFLLYIGASDILPEAHSKESSYKIMALTVLGALFIFVVSRFI
jgi:ZIP family zinc transporter